MKYQNYIVALFLTATTLSAQEVKLKKNVVYLDDTPAFSFAKKGMGSELHVYKLNTQEELFNMMTESNGTESKVDDSMKIVFTQQKSTVQSGNLRGRDWDFLITVLLQEKVIDPNGTINPDNLKRFKGKYDENDPNHNMH